jgi:phosphoribosylformylglycinamidine cyclo-ligase
VIDPLPPVPEIFKLIQEKGEVSAAEMYEVFNMGTGFVVVVNGMEEFTKISTICKKHDVAAQVIGCVEPCQGKEVTIPEFNLIGRGQKITKIK